jgi:uncharacterized protein YraI
VLLLTAIVLVAIGHGDDEGSGSSNVVAPAGNDDDETPVIPIGGLLATASTTASYRNGPDTRFVILGTIPRGAHVAVVGRSEDNAWLQVRYPPNSNLKGWVDAKLLRVEGDVTVLAIAGPGPVASVDSVTYVPTIGVYEPEATLPPPTVEEEETPEEPATAAARPTRTPTARPTVTPYRTPFPTSTPPQVPTEQIPPQSQP